MPTPTDACLRCTNLRYLDGTKPRWSDRVDSWFMIPMSMIRFVRSSSSRVEVPRSSLSNVEGIIPLGAVSRLDDASHVFEDLEPDQDLIRRIREA